MSHALVRRTSTGPISLRTAPERSASTLQAVEVPPAAAPSAAVPGVIVPPTAPRPATSHANRASALRTPPAPVLRTGSSPDLEPAPPRTRTHPAPPRARTHPARTPSPRTPSTGARSRTLPPDQRPPEQQSDQQTPASDTLPPQRRGLTPAGVMQLPAGARSLFATGTDTAATRRRIDLAVLVLACLVFTALPSFIDIQLGGRLAFTENSTGPVVRTGLGDAARSLVTPIPYLLLGYLLIRNLGMGGRRIGTAVLFAAFCAAISAASFVSIGDSTFAYRDVAVIVAGVWLIQPRAADLVVIARFGTGIAAVSLLLAAIGLDGWMAEGAGAGKGLLTDRLLAGPFPQMNVLGMALAVSLPFSMLLPTRPRRWTAIAVMTAALLLTSSRTSLLAIAVATAAYLAILITRGRVRSAVAWAATAGAVVAIAVLPAITDDPDAFTDRGEIWMTSLDLLPDNWLFGLGISAYSPDGAVTLAGDMLASWHGHNTVVTALVMGGIVTAGLFLLIYLTAIAHTISRIRTQPALFWSALTLLAIGLAETPARFDTFDGAAWITWPVLAALLFLPSAAPEAPVAGGDAAAPEAPAAGGVAAAPEVSVRGSADPAAEAVAEPAPSPLPGDRTRGPYYRDAVQRRARTGRMQGQRNAGR